MPCYATIAKNAGIDGQGSKHVYIHVRITPGVEMRFCNKVATNDAAESGLPKNTLSEVMLFI